MLWVYSPYCSGVNSVKEQTGYPLKCSKHQCQILQKKEAKKKKKSKNSNPPTYHKR